MTLTLRCFVAFLAFLQLWFSGAGPALALRWPCAGVPVQCAVPYSERFIHIPVTLTLTINPDPNQ
jgi:hypothetical protein